MKNLFRMKFIAGALLLCFAFISCEDEAAPIAVPDTTITGLAKATPSLSILVQALVKANLATTLQGTGPFTVFAPNDVAFNAFLTSRGFVTNGMPDINQVPTDVLTQVLLNHVVSGRVLSGGLTNNTYIKTLGVGRASSNPLSMYVNTASGVRLNGVSSVITTASGTTFNIAASNGVIHLVDAVIDLPTIVTHAAANPNFARLVTVVTSTGGTFGNQSAIATRLSSTTDVPLTVFAPVNAALDAAIAAGAWANGATGPQFTRVLQYHVTAAGNVLSNTLTNNQPIPTLTTSPTLNLIVDLTAGAKLQDTTPVRAGIIVTDVQCSNGIIHAVDKVLQPTF